jgi:hypothetical protein
MTIEDFLEGLMGGDERCHQIDAECAYLLTLEPTERAYAMAQMPQVQRALYQTHMDVLMDVYPEEVNWGDDPEWQTASPETPQ